MNATIAKALLQDAFYQVLDNKVFRMLVLVAICLILPTFLVGAREDGIHVLFGWKTFTYKEFFGAFGAPVPLVRDLNVAFIQGVQTFVVQGLAGMVGILFCIAATAFFIPRMLEKGAADMQFSKPVARIVLLLARYVAGLVFVGVLSFGLVLGMHVGFLVTSGYSDPGFLWSALTLVYAFALVHAFSTAIAVFTRSSVAAILCTLLFYTFNGCIQGLWVAKEHGEERTRLERESDESESKTAPERRHAFVAFLTGTLDVLHWALPKTHDADVLTKKLRTVVTGREWALVDPTGKLTVAKDPAEFTRETPGGTVDLEKSPATWVAKSAEGVEAGRITLSRRSRLIDRGESKAKGRQTASAAARELMASLKSRSANSGDPVQKRESASGLTREWVRWTEEAPEGPLSREHAFFPIDETMFELDVTMRQDWHDQDNHGDLVPRFLDGVKQTRESAANLESAEWYELRFGWSAPFRYNAFVSLATSFAFLLVMLGLSNWRLSRIDF